MDINIFIFLSVFFVLVFLLGRFFDKFRIPWIFSSLIIGAILALKNPFNYITSSNEFLFLANLGMLSLLFIIGFEIDIKKMKKFAKFIVEATFFIILFEAIIGTALVHFVFGCGWMVSFIVGISFATVGEAILVPILDKFKMVNTRLGQLILGIGTFDDLFEIGILIILVLFLGVKSSNVLSEDIFGSIITISMVFILTALFIRFKNTGEKFKTFSIETKFLLSMSVLFLFIGLGKFSGSSALGALLAGISLRTVFPAKKLKNIKNGIKSLCYGFLAPIFFLSVGLSLNINYIISSFWLILLVFFVAAFAKLFASYILTSKKIGKKNAILLGVGLSARFSTSIVIIKILLESGLIKEDLYSAIVASSILFTLIIPILFSKLVVKWKHKNEK